MPFVIVILHTSKAAPLTQQDFNLNHNKVEGNEKRGAAFQVSQYLFIGCEEY